MAKRNPAPKRRYHQLLSDSELSTLDDKCNISDCLRKEGWRMVTDSESPLNPSDLNVYVRDCDDMIEDIDKRLSSSHLWIWSDKPEQRTAKYRDLLERARKWAKMVRRRMLENIDKQERQ